VLLVTSILKEHAACILGLEVTQLEAARSSAKLVSVMLKVDTMKVTYLGAK